jgi:hypothetical protein
MESSFINKPQQQLQHDDDIINKIYKTKIHLKLVRIFIIIYVQNIQVFDNNNNKKNVKYCLSESIILLHT